MAVRTAPAADQFAAGHGGSGFDADSWSTGEEPARRLDGKRILIVEDEALVALDLEFGFEDEGAEVVGPALSLRDAIELLGSDARIDGAVLDVDLGGKDVFPVAQVLRDRGIPFVFHTGHATRTELDQRFPGSITCAKPSFPTTLIAALLNLIN